MLSASHQDAYEVFKKALGIDPNFTDDRDNLAKATSGNGQILQINRNDYTGSYDQSHWNALYNGNS